MLQHRHHARSRSNSGRTARSRRRGSRRSSRLRSQDLVLGCSPPKVQRGTLHHGTVCLGMLVCVHLRKFRGKPLLLLANPLLLLSAELRPRRLRTQQLTSFRCEHARLHQGLAEDRPGLMRHVTLVAEVHLEHHLRQFLDRRPVRSCLEPDQSLSPCVQQKLFALLCRAYASKGVLLALPKALHAHGLLWKHVRHEGVVFRAVLRRVVRHVNHVLHHARQRLHSRNTPLFCGDAASIKSLVFLRNRQFVLCLLKDDLHPLAPRFLRFRARLLARQSKLNIRRRLWTEKINRGRLGTGRPGARHAKHLSRRRRRWTR